MRFPFQLSSANKNRSGFVDPGAGPRDDGQLQAQFCRDLQSGVLKVQTAGFGVTEEPLDGPPPPVGVQGVLLCHIACDDAYFATLDALAHEGECQGRQLPRLGREARNLRAMNAGM